MYFLLKSEVESIDIDKNYIKKIVYCPFCKNVMLKKLDSNNFYDKYQCWNVKCEKKSIPFIFLKEYIQCEDLFKKECDSCKKPYNREFIHNGKDELLIKFSCIENNCETNLNPYCYNIIRAEWEGNPPRFIDYEEKINNQDNNQETDGNTTQEMRYVKIDKEDLIEFGLKDMANHTYKIEETPLLRMKDREYNKFLKYHKGKFVILVDVPDFIRSLREVIQFNFEHILQKAHQLLVEYIKLSFHTFDDYLIHYFSKPDEDFELANKIIIDLCMKNRNREFFHYIKIPRGRGYSDIDNFLITYGIEILERGRIRGFGTVCSEKDYLPLMLIASYKNIKSFLLGIKTPKIYEKYEIENIELLEIKKFFEILT
ncbi:MAG: hypothetical protein ACFFEY_18725 [Candidatus Thorarchaeota archaeon]